MLSLEAKVMIISQRHLGAGEKLARLRAAEPGPPATEAARQLAARLRAAQAELAVRGEPHYPAALEALGAQAPRWVWLRGRASGGSAELKLPGPGACCAVVGSRRTEPRLLEAAERLGRQLARQGVLVASGGACGADQAAHRGAARESGGTLLAPPCGLLTLLRKGFARELARAGGAALLALDQPDDPFSAGLAVRRNHALAALAGAVVLVASDLRGGSSYAVRWALEHRRPVFCLEAGRATPPANRSLLGAGAARALSLGRSPEHWAVSVCEALEQFVTEPTPSISQGELLLEPA